jgi:hypothetical protein
MIRYQNNYKLWKLCIWKHVKERPKRLLSGSFQGWLQGLEVYSNFCPNYSLATHIMQAFNFHIYFYFVLNIVHTHEHPTTSTKMRKHITFYLNKSFKIVLETKWCLNMVGKERHESTTCSKYDRLGVVCCWWHLKNKLTT